MSDYFCQWCYDRGLRYPDNGKPWGHAIECPFRPTSQTMSESQMQRIRMNDLLVKANKHDLALEEESELKILTLQSNVFDLQSELTATRARLAELEGIAERLSSDLRAVQEEQRGDVFAASIRDFAAYKEGKK